MIGGQHIDGFAKSDPMGYVFSYLAAQDQGSLRSSAWMFHEAFDAAVNAQIHIGQCGNEELCKQEEVGALGSWFPVTEKRCCQDPASRRLGTLAVNLHILFNGAPRIPHRFLRGCVARSIIYFQADHITSAGDWWMGECPCLTNMSFESLTALTTAGSYWLHCCTSLTSSNPHEKSS